MAVKILFRASLAEEEELSIAKKYFEVIESRLDVEEGDLIIGRYSVLPYYLELEKDVKAKGAELINSHLRHQYVSDILNWYGWLKDMTPKTWFEPSEVPAEHDGPFVLKGRINSRKQLWRTSMFAPTRKEMMPVYCRLLDDSLLHYQGICIREFEQFVKFGENPITHCPISKEFRIFLLDGKVMARGYYWSEYEEARNVKDNIPDHFIQEIIKKIGYRARFIIVDVAQKEDGSWRVVEVGDAQMGGLSCCNPDQLYKNMADILK